MSLEAIVWVLKHSEATRGRRLVLLALADYAHPDGTSAWPKVETLARHSRMTRKAVQDALRKLEADGLIVRSGTSRSGTNVYAIVGPGDNAGDDEGGGAKFAPSRGVVTTPDPLDERGIKEVEKSFAAVWGKLAPPLVRHPDRYFASSRFRSALRAALRTYDAASIEKAIENYAEVLSSPRHYFKHRYGAADFLSRPRATPGVEYFVDEALPLENFLSRRDENRDRDGNEQRTPAERLQLAERWVLLTAWRLPLEEHEVAEQLGRRGVEGPDRGRLLDLWRSKRDLAA